MKNIVHIKSKIPASIAINGQLFETNNIDIIHTRNFYITFYPNNNNLYFPCATAVNSAILPTEIKKIPYNNNHYEIIYNPTKLPQLDDEVVILNKKYKNTIFNIKNSSQSFITITSTTKSHASTTQLITSINFKTIDDYVIITGNCDSKNTYLLIYNTKKQSIVVENLFMQVEVSKSYIKALKQEKSVVGYGTIFEFNIQSKSLNKYYAYIDKSAKLCDYDEIVVLSFLESVQHGDYKKSTQYLDNNKTSNEHIKKYFGNIEEIHFNGYSQDINYTILSDGRYRNFTFSLDNHKIIDIEENELN